MSQLFEWYRVDFGKNDKEVIDWIKANGGSGLSSKFSEFEMAINQANYQIKYDVYDWGLNSK